MNYRIWAASGLAITAAVALSACAGSTPTTSPVGSPSAPAPSTSPSSAAPVPTASPSPTKTALTVPSRMDGELARATMIDGEVSDERWQKVPKTGEYDVTGKCVLGPGETFTYTVWINGHKQPPARIGCEGVPFLNHLGTIKAGSIVEVGLTKVDPAGEAWVVVIPKL